jgi:hypothetical protein
MLSRIKEGWLSCVSPAECKKEQERRKRGRREEGRGGRGKYQVQQHCLWMMAVARSSCDCGELEGVLACRCALVCVDLQNIKEGREGKRGRVKDVDNGGKGEDTFF